MPELDVAALADEMLDALDHAQLVVRPSDRFTNLDFDTAYRVAGETTRRRLARGEQPIGRKIGYTNRDMWKRFGVNQPIWSDVYAHTLQFASDGRASQAVSRMVAPRIEPEIAFKLKAPLEAGCREPAAILTRLEWMAPAFEIVDCHYRDWEFTGPDSVIDFSHHASLILGEPCTIVPSAIAGLADALARCRVSLFKDETLFDSGEGKNALGHPAMALAHLADVLATQLGSAPLSAGEIITTGTLTVAHAIHSGESWRCDFDGIALRSLAVKFE